MSTVNFELTLAQSKSGRILLHLGAFLKDRNLRWHLEGALRELAPHVHARPALRITR